MNVVCGWTAVEIVVSSEAGLDLHFCMCIFLSPSSCLDWIPFYSI